MLAMISPYSKYYRMTRIPFYLFHPRKSSAVQTSEGRTVAPIWATTAWLFVLRSENRKYLLKLQPLSSLQRTDIFPKNKLSIQLNFTTGKYCSYSFGKICSIMLLQSPAINSNKPHWTEKFCSRLHVQYKQHVLKVRKFKYLLFLQKY